MSWDKTKITLAVLVVIMAVLGSIFAPAYKSVINERTTLKEINETLLTRISVQQSEITRLSSSKATHRVKGSLREPIKIGGSIAYREAKWEASDTSDVRSAVVDALASVQSSSQSSTQSSSMYSERSQTIIKRQTVSIGPGWGSEGLPCGLIVGRIVGPLSLWGMTSIDTANKSKPFKSGAVGGLISFF